MNVLFITIDTLRADHLSCYGYTKPTSPNIDQLAGRGVKFLNCFSQSNCTHPGYTTMFSGLYPLSHDVVAHDSPESTIQPWVRMLAEMLQTAGFATYSVSSLVNYPAGVHFQRGYDEWEFTAPNIPQYQSGLKVPAEYIYNVAKEKLERHQAQSPDKPFFCFVHFWDPHATYLPPEQYQRFYDKNLDEAYNPEHDTLGFILERQPRNYFFSLRYGPYQWGIKDREYITSLYDGEINYADDYVGKLLQLLEDLNLAEETLVILTADHGEVLTEDLNFVYGQPFYYAHLGLTDPNIHIPLIIANPKCIPTGKSYAQFVQHIDITPTILDILGLTPSDVGVNYEFDGISLNRLIQGQTETTRDWIYILENSYEKRRGLRGQKWKYVENLDMDLKFPSRAWLYDLVNDPKEEFNLIDHLPEIADILQNQLNNWVTICCAKFQKEDPQKYIATPLGENQKKKIRDYYKKELEKLGN